MSSVDAEVLEELAQPFLDREIQRNTYTGIVDRTYSVTHLACRPLGSQASAITVLLRSAVVC